MSEQITESVHFDRGYNKGFVNGLKRAFELVGELGNFYENGLTISENATEQEKELHKNSNKNKVNACRYAQHVIRKNSFGEEDLPW